MNIQLLHEECYYHIFNQGNNKGNIFFNNGNYEYMLRKMDFYLTDVLDIYCFCLLPNHFHMLVKVNTWKEIEKNIFKYKGLDKLIENRADKVEIIVSELFRRLFMSYSKAINVQQERNGSLFRKYFKRKLIDNNAYLIRTVIYIHQNPAHHGIYDNFKNYPWSSYNRILEEKISKLKKKELIKLFDNYSNFQFVHEMINNEIDDIEY
jgi:putative transposase